MLIFIPQMVTFSGRNHCRRELCPQMVTVSGRKLHSGAKGNTFVPEKGIFPGETTAGGELCSQMWPVSGRNHCRWELCPQMVTVSGRKLHSGAKGNTFVPEKGIFPGETIAAGNIYPQNTLPAWTNADPRQCASTKYPPSVDKCRRPAVASTKYPPSVDKCHPPAVRINKIPSQRG